LAANKTDPMKYVLNIDELHLMHSIQWHPNVTVTHVVLLRLQGVLWRDGFLSS
jgi:hypothetical protein